MKIGGMGQHIAVRDRDSDVVDIVTISVERLFEICRREKRKLASQSIQFEERCIHAADQCIAQTAAFAVFVSGFKVDNDGLVFIYTYCACIFDGGRAAKVKSKVDILDRRIFIDVSVLQGLTARWIKCSSDVRVSQRRPTKS